MRTILERNIYIYIYLRRVLYFYLKCHFKNIPHVQVDNHKLICIFIINQPTKTTKRKQSIDCIDSFEITFIFETQLNYVS